MNMSCTVVTLALTGLGLLVACGGDGTEPVTTITVSGLVRERGGEPISGEQVLIAGKNPVTTGADGRFSIPGVTVPYDITLLLTSHNTALVYKGLTRADPALLTLDRIGPQQSATISGTTPPAPGKDTFVFFNSGRNVVGAGHADMTTGLYALTSTWQGSVTTHPGQLHVLRWTTGSLGEPVSYDAYASKPLTISAGGDFPGNDFVTGDLTDPPEQSIGGAVVPPVGYSQTRRRFLLLFERIPILWDEPGPSSNAFTFTVPAVSGVLYSVEAWGADAASRVSFFFKYAISGNTANTSIPLAPAAQLAFPVDGATSVDATTSFGWVQGGGTGVNIFEVLPHDANNTTYVVFTTETDAKIPDLAGVGMALPTGAAYSWWVDRVFPVASMNDAVGDGFLRLIDEEAGDLGETLSEGRTFTTRTAAGTAVQGSAVGPTAAATRAASPRTWILRPGDLDARLDVHSKWEIP